MAKGLSPSGRKQKGNRFEIETARALSLWMSGGQARNLFWRSGDSGAGATFAYRAGDKDRGSLDAGDITARSIGAYEFLSVFFVECKHRKFGGEQGLSRMLYGAKSPADIFWDEPYGKACELNMHLFSVWRVDRRSPMLSVSTPVWDMFQKASRGKLKKLSVLYRNPYETQDHQVHSTDFGHWQEALSWAGLRRTLEREKILVRSDY